MTRRFRLTDFGRSISLPEVAAYLSSQGWKTHPEGSLIVCEGPLDDAGQPIIAFVPGNETSPDYPLRVEDLIYTLSTLEERPAIDIANKMVESVELADDEAKPFKDRLPRVLTFSVPGNWSVRNAVQLAMGLEPLLENVALGGESFQQVALFLTRSSRLLEDENEPRLLLWRLCELIGVQLHIRSPAQLDEFFNIAVTDDPNSPDALFEWLCRNSVLRTAGSPEEHATPENRLGSQD